MVFINSDKFKRESKVTTSKELEKYTYSKKKSLEVKCPVNEKLNRTELNGNTQRRSFTPFLYPCG